MAGRGFILITTLGKGGEGSVILWAPKAWAFQVVWGHSLLENFEKCNHKQVEMQFLPFEHISIDVYFTHDC